MVKRKEIRVFVSSPGDCGPEREAVARVLDELNTTVGERERLYFHAVRWEDFPPGLGNPQAVIDSQLGDYNVLVGIMWLRLGTPIPDGAESGTAHELQMATESWKRVGEPRVMFYFKEDLPKSLSDIDPDQLKKVRDFRSSLHSTALFQTFTGTMEFETKLRIHMHKLAQHLSRPTGKVISSSDHPSPSPYDRFEQTFREVIGAQRMSGTGALLHIVFGDISDIRQIVPVIPVSQGFDLQQRHPRGVLYGFGRINVNGKPFFDEIERIWPHDTRPKSAGLGNAQFVALPQNTSELPGVMFVVSTRNISDQPADYGLYANTPVQGIDYIVGRVITAANSSGLAEIALPLVATGFANIGRTHNNVKLAMLLRRAGALITIGKLEQALQDEASSLQRGIVVIYSNQPHSEKEQSIWEAVTRYVGTTQEGRLIHIKEILAEIDALCT